MNGARHAAVAIDRIGEWENALKSRSAVETELTRRSFGWPLRLARGGAGLGGVAFHPAG